jgi:hypothetical protein
MYNPESTNDSKLAYAIALANHYLKEYTREELEQLAFDSLVDRLVQTNTEKELQALAVYAGIEGVK